MRRTRTGIATALAGASAAGAVAAVSLTGGGSAPAAPPAPRPATASIVRTNLVDSALVEGTLGYQPTGPLINAVVGTYTWLPRPDQVVLPDHQLYRVNDSPVMLLAGSVPAWRSFELGMTDGRDVAELQAALIAGHFAAGLLTAPTGQFTLATADAVDRWQTAHGIPVSGQIPLGTVVFLPHAVRVGAWQVAPGEDATPGQQPYQVSIDRSIVTVPVNPDMPTIHIGQRVSVLLPSQARVPGTISAVGPPPPTPASTDGTLTQTTSVQLTITLSRPPGVVTGPGTPVQVSLATQEIRDVLAAPVAALLALAGGGYGVEIVLPSGAHHLVGVQTGMFAGGMVQISGRGLVAGTKVEVAQ